MSGKDVKGLLAEAIAKKLSKLALLNIDVLSCTLEPLNEIPDALYRVLEEKGYPTVGIKPRTLEEIPYEEVDILITLSPQARDNCPYVQTHKRREHWNIEDVESNDLNTLRRLRDQIEDSIRALLKLS